MAETGGLNRCPTCGSVLSRERYLEVLHLDEKQKAELENAKEEAKQLRGRLEETEARVRAEERKKAHDRARKKFEQKWAKEVQEIEKGIREKQADERTELETENERLQSENDRVRKEIKDLEHKADAGNRGHFGPESEKHLLEALTASFKTDKIEPLGRGGDILHTIIESGRSCGRIVYECKKTASWKDASYVRQLKRAMSTQDTQHGLLVSRALPKGSQGLSVVKGVLVVAPNLATELARILRAAIVELARMRLSQEGKAQKTAELYGYIRSDAFSNALTRVSDTLKELGVSLEREKQNHQGVWNRREQHYGAILREATGIEARVKEILSAHPVVPSTRRHRSGAVLAARRGRRRVVRSRPAS